MIGNNNGFKSISKLFRLVINRLVYRLQYSSCLIGWKDETAPTEKRNVEGMRQFQCIPKTYVNEIKETDFEIYTKQVSCPLAFLF